MYFGCVPQKLEYTVGDQQEPLSPVGKGLSDEKVQVELDRLIKEKRAANEDVFDWVDKDVGVDNIKKPAFIRALMTSVCSSAITCEFILPRPRFVQKLLQGFESHGIWPKLSFCCLPNF